MNVRILDLTRQYEIIKDKVEKAVCEQMSSGAYIGGKAVADFEKKFADYVGAEYAIAVNSGTDALIISMKALGIGKGDEVITTPFTFFATAETIAMTSATPVFVDVCDDTYNIDPAKIEEKITDKTKAIIPVHIFGQPADLDAILEIADKHGLYVIEDACQAVGSSIGERMVGSMGDAACFSFFPTKNLGGFGDGGMITTNDEKTAVICRAFREHGGAANGAKARFYLDGVEDDLAGSASDDPLYNPYKYYNYLIAYNSRLDAIQARVLDIKLDHLGGFNSNRTAIAAFYEKELGAIDGVTTPKVRDGVTPVWHQYAIRVKEKDGLGRFLAGKNIGSAAFYPVPLHLQKAFDYLGYKEGDLPVAEQLTRETVCLPIFPELREDELNYIVSGIKEYYER